MNWIGIFISLLKVLTVLVSILIVFVVLLQRPKNEGLGAAFGGDTASNIFGAQTTNVLAVLTRWLGGIFLTLCLLIAILGNHDSVIKGIVTTAIQKSNAEKAARDKQEEDKKAAEAAAKNIAPIPVVQPEHRPGPAPVPATALDVIKPAAPVSDAPKQPLAPEPVKPVDGDQKPQ